MGYHVIDPADLSIAPNRPSAMRSISDAANLDTLGLRIYDVAPGEDVPLRGLHYHEEQEEAFYVVTGSVSAETPDGTFSVGAGEFFVVHPRNPHRLFNDDSSESAARIVGIGAPSGTDSHSVER